MQKPINLIETLKLNKLYLMLNDNENEVYDKDGNLLLYKADTGDYMTVPNTEEIRKLYDLPLETPEIRDTLNKEDILKAGGFVRVQNDTNQVVWLGQKTEHSIRATRYLIELYNSPKYQTLMKNPKTIRLKVWEQIASELQRKGYKIASNSRDAGLRTFQKWRNMERTYWKFTKAIASCGDDSRRRKPYFFDDLHAVLSKQSKESSLESSNHCSGQEEDGIDEDGIGKQDEDDECGIIKKEDYGEDGIREPEDDGDFEMDDDSRTELCPPKRKCQRISDLYGTEYEAFPRQALNLLTSLVTSPKYEECLYTNSHKPLPYRQKVWESIYVDMARAGWKFGANTREGAFILSQKWRMVEKTILRKRLCGPRTLYTPALRRAVLLEVEKRKGLGPNNISSPPSPPDPTTVNNRKPKGGEIEPDVIEALLKIVGSGHYQNLFAKSGGKRSRIWEKIYEEIESQGFRIAGGTKQQKVTRLFQKWRNMKRSFVKYQIAKSKGNYVKKPMFYERMFQIISHDVMKMNNPDIDLEGNMEDWDEESDSESFPDLLELSQPDHDYSLPFETNETTVQLANNIKPEKKKPTFEDICGPSQSLSSQPSTSRSSRSHEVLKQIKSLYETSLAVQQQNFTKIISLLENQISQQQNLTTVITEYIRSQANTSKSKDRRMENVK